MKRIISTGVLMSGMLFFLCFSLIGLSGNAQSIQPEPSHNFQIFVERTADGIMLKSTKGTAWINLSFSLRDYQEMTIDEFGMVDPDATGADNSDKALADFCFTIMKTRGGIVLKSLKGTAWKELTFSLPMDNSQVIDQQGLVER
ncbi:MAG: hypothetical protein M9898_09285 [Chitinophagaceae bacterium]|nr:hypothetical protein [Chitinophagaceae bacterium]